MPHFIIVSHLGLIIPEPYRIKEKNIPSMLTMKVSQLLLYFPKSLFGGRKSDLFKQEPSIVEMSSAARSDGVE